MMSEAMRWAVDQINGKPGYLYNYKLGIKSVYDTIEEEDLRKNILDTFKGRVPFIIGPYSAETSYMSNILTRTFQQIAISYSATYSDFDAYKLNDQQMLRTVPSDRFRVMAVLRLMQNLKWNYMAVVSSYGYDGEREASHFTSKLSGINACLATQIDLTKYPTEESYRKAVEMLLTDSRLSIVLLFTTSEDTRQIMRMLKSMGHTKRFHLVCVYGCTNYANVIEGNEEVADGTLSLDINIPEVPKFRKYFKSLKVNNKSPQYMQVFWEQLFDCTFNTNLSGRVCTGQEVIEEGKGYYASTPVFTVIEAVFHLARAIRSFVELFCHHERDWMTGQDKCIIDVMDHKSYTQWIHKVLVKKTNKDGTLDPLPWGKNNNTNRVMYDVHRFTFDNRVSRYEKIWQWQVARQDEVREPKNCGHANFLRTWLNDTKNMTRLDYRGTCSRDCPLGSIHEHDQNSLKSKCCWTCKQCPKNHRTINNECQPCKASEKVGPLYQTCLQLEEMKINWRKPIVLAFVILSIIGICLTIFVGLIFFKNNDNRIVRASGRDLTYTILLGICISFACPFVFLWETRQSTCVLRGGLPGFSFLLCYAPLFLKTIRIYRIFVGAQVSVSRPALVSIQSQFIVLFIILSTQLLISVVWFVSKVPIPEIIVSGEYITQHCSGDASPILLFLNLSLSVIFMISCTVLAFKTRHFPKNFNEAKFIGITLYITCVGWSVFLPVYFLSPHLHKDFMKELLMCGICLFIGYVTLFGLFGYKIKLLLIGPLPPSREGSDPTWYLPRDHSKSLCSTHSCECKMFSPKSCCEELNSI